MRHKFIRAQWISKRLCVKNRKNCQLWSINQWDLIVWRPGKRPIIITPFEYLSSWILIYRGTNWVWWNQFGLCHHNLPIKWRYRTYSSIYLVSKLYETQLPVFAIGRRTLSRLHVSHGLTGPWISKTKWITAQQMFKALLSLFQKIRCCDSSNWPVCQLHMEERDIHYGPQDWYLSTKRRKQCHILNSIGFHSASPSIAPPPQTPWGTALLQPSTSSVPRFLILVLLHYLSLFSLLSQPTMGICNRYVF